MYDYDLFRYHLGCAMEVTNIYPQLVAKSFCDGIRQANEENHEADKTARDESIWHVADGQAIKNIPHYSGQEIYQVHLKL